MPELTMEELGVEEAVRVLQEPDDLVRFADSLADRGDVAALHSFAELLVVEMAGARTEARRLRSLCEANEASARRAVLRADRFQTGIQRLRETLQGLAS